MNLGKATHLPLYQSIADEISRKISIGELAPGDRILSIGGFCDHYGVSTITAHRTVSELKKLGLIRTIPRKGSYVTGLPEAPVFDERSVGIARIVVIEGMRHARSSLPKGVTPFIDGVSAGIREVAQTEHIHLRSEYVPSDPMAGRRAHFEPARDDGIIVLGGGVSLFAMSILMSRHIPSVLVDSVAVKANCVATDNLSGADQMMEHLYELGHRRVTIAVAFNLPANPTNENERRDAFAQSARVRGMAPTVCQSGDFQELFDLLDGPSPPTAVAFTQDQPASRFIRMARERGRRIPEDVSVAGFDDWDLDPEMLSQLTTVHVDREELGRTAARQLLEPPQHAERFCVWTRVRPQLIIRSSTGRVA